MLVSGDSRVVGFRRALGINSSLDVEVNINDQLFSRLYTAVRGVVRALAKAGLVEYIEDLGVVNLARMVSMTDLDGFIGIIKRQRSIIK